MKSILYILAAIGALIVGGLMLGGGEPEPVGLHTFEPVPSVASTNPHMQYIGKRSVCPQLGPMAIVLPSDKDQLGSALYEQAYRLIEQGTCVIEGGFGRSMGLYYLAVRNHDGGQPYFLRYSEAELNALKQP